MFSLLLLNGHTLLHLTIILLLIASGCVKSRGEIYYRTYYQVEIILSVLTDRITQACESPRDGTHPTCFSFYSVILMIYCRYLSRSMASRHAARIRSTGKCTIWFGKSLQTTETNESILDILEEHRRWTGGRPDARTYR